MRTLLENLREDERLVSQDVKVGGRYVVNDIGQAIAEIVALTEQLRVARKEIDELSDALHEATDMSYVAGGE